MNYNGVSEGHAENLLFESTRHRRVAVEWKPKDPQQIVRWYCYDCRKVHGIQGC